jgi:hypothetical protein
MSEEKTEKLDIRMPKIALTVQLAKEQLSPAEAKRVLIEAIGRIPDAELRALRSGVVTVVA